MRASEEEGEAVAEKDQYFLMSGPVGMRPA